MQEGAKKGPESENHDPKLSQFSRAKLAGPLLFPVVQILGVSSFKGVPSSLIQLGQVITSPRRVLRAFLKEKDKHTKQVVVFNLFNFDIHSYKAETKTHVYIHTQFT